MIEFGNQTVINNPPLVTIILPIRNEAAYIGRSLEALLLQDYPGEMELLVVDGLSTDSTCQILKSYLSKHLLPPLHQRFTFQILTNPEKIVPISMNIALRLAKGDIIIRVDGHCIIEADYVRKCVEHIFLDGIDGVGGPMQTIGETPLSRVIAVAMSSPFGVGGSAFRTVSGKTILVDTVPFPAYTRDIVMKAGAYDEELVRNQDDEYNYRIRELGGKILLAGDVQSKYYSRGSLAKLWKQYFQYGYWKVRVFQKHPFQMSVRQFIPPLFVGSLIVLSLLTPFFYWGRLLFASVIASYVFANLIASTITAGKCGWKHFPALPICYAILHLSYGTGFLTGLVKFINRWGDKKGRVPELRLIHASRS